MKISKKFLTGVLLLTVGVLLLSSSNLVAQVTQPTLERIEETSKIRIGFREASPPFAYVDEKGEYVGFSVDMAKLLVDRLSVYFGKDIELVPIAVEAKTRVPLVANSTIDISMECCTHTAARDEVVDFSLPYFLAETLFITRADSGITTLQDLNGKIVSATRGTTNLEALEKVIDEGVITPQDLVITESHSKAFYALKTKKVDAHFTDSSLLMGLKMSADHPEDYVIIKEAVSYEPYGFPVREGDSDFLDFVNNFMIWTLVTGKYYEVYDEWMGPESGVPIPRSAGFDALLNAMQWPGVSEDWPEK